MSWSDIGCVVGLGFVVAVVTLLVGMLWRADILGRAEWEGRRDSLRRYVQEWYPVCPGCQSDKKGDAYEDWRCSWPDYEIVHITCRVCGMLIIVTRWEGAWRSRYMRA